MVGAALPARDQPNVQALNLRRVNRRIFFRNRTEQTSLPKKSLRPPQRNNADDESLKLTLPGPDDTYRRSVAYRPQAGCGRAPRLQQPPPQPRGCLHIRGADDDLFDGSHAERPAAALPQLSAQTRTPLPDVNIRRAVLAEEDVNRRTRGPVGVGKLSQSDVRE